MYKYRIRSAGNKTPIYEPAKSCACLPYVFPVAMPQGIVLDVLLAGIDASIKHGELWLQVHRHAGYQLFKCAVRTTESAHTSDASYMMK